VRAVSRRPAVTVVGSINQDMVARVPRLPGPGETVLGHDLVMVPGGKGLNQAVAAARAGAMTSFIGMVGDDSAGQHLLAVLDEEGVDTRGVATVGALTGRALISVADDGENHIVVVPGANAAVSVAHVDRHHAPVERARVVLAQLEIPLVAVEAALRRARAAGVTTILNATPPLPLDAELLRLVDVLVVNEHEAAALAGGSVSTSADASDAGRALRATGCGVVVVTLGSEGAVLVSEGGVVHRPAIRVEVIDTTAAGDAFAGTFAARLAAGADAGDALRWAVAAGALAVTTLGAAPSIPARSDVERLLDRPG
jgi:ribokinase